MVPSVFVLFLRLVDLPTTESTSMSLVNSPVTSLAGTAPTSPSVAAPTDDPIAKVSTSPSQPEDVPVSKPELENRRKEAERLADEQLIKVIAERRKKLAERGIKFTIVLMTGRDMLGQSQQFGEVEATADAVTPHRRPVA
jgi:hypothetical protein